MVTRSRSLQVLTTSLALMSCVGSIRMSSGASAAYENPRSGRSSCIEETPRSSRIASARTPLSASCGRTTPKSPRRSRAFTVARFARRSKYVRAVGSRSIAMSFPLPRRSAARIAAWPPAPKVASTTVSPGRTPRDARTSSARTGTWSASLGCKTFGNILSTPFDFGELGPPGGPVPDLEVVVDPGDDDVAAELRVLEQRGREDHAALPVGDRLGRTGEEVTVEATAVHAEHVQRAEPGVHQSVPCRSRPSVETAVEPARHDAAVLERPAELRREGEAVLVVDCVLVLAEKHGALSLSHHCTPLYPTMDHLVQPGQEIRQSRRTSPDVGRGFTIGTD